jgi:UDP-2,3-diacylglucosamine hydrolase
MQKLSFISDIHVRSADDHRYKLLLSYLKNEKVLDSNIICFGGDIFDRMIGSYSEYIDEFKSYFNLLKELVESKKQVIYLQGNHDFHLDQLYSELFYPYKNFQLIKNYIVIEFNNKKTLLTHGDILDFSDLSYLKYRSFITGSLCYLVSQGFFSYKLVKYIGDTVSGQSNRSKGYKIDLKKEQSKYHQLIDLLPELKLDQLICGHSHIKDKVSKQGRIYINNGFCPEEKVFIHYDGEQFDFQSL